MASKTVHITVSLLFLLASIYVSCLELGCGGKQYDEMKVFDAVAQGNISAVKAALDHGFPATYWNNLDGQLPITPIHAAAQAGHTEVLRLFLDGGLKVDLKLQDGSTPLILAASSGKVDTVTLLLDHMADTTLVGGVPGGGQLNPLIAAVQSGSLDTVNVLIEHGANVNANIGTMTPLAMSVTSRHFDLVKPLLQHRAQVDTTSIQIARQSGRKDIATLMLRSMDPAGARIARQFYCPDCPI
jgi:ankyrin repeat protein